MEHNDLVQDLIKHWLLDEDLNSKVKTLSDEQDKGESKELEKESDGRDLDLKLLQKTTGHLQELCRQAKKGGADK